MFKVEESRFAYDPVADTYGERYPANPDLVYPVLESTATDIMDGVTYIYDSSLLPSDFDNWFEVRILAY